MSGAGRNPGDNQKGHVMEDTDHLRFHAPHAHLAAPFGSAGFGQLAERIARFFGTPQYLIGQSTIVLLWIVVNAIALLHAEFDPTPSSC